jgi:pimeloyl-ACP methyl ester carboxylesterase
MPVSTIAPQRATSTQETSMNAIYHPRSTAALLALLAAGLGACSNDDDETPAPTQTLAEQCPSLAGATFAGATVTAATVAAASGAQPESCVVQVKMNDSALRFEARLPTAGWNEKLAFLGGGGFDGSIASATLPYHSESILTERYATMATNGGHDAPANLLDVFKAEFAYDPVQLADFTYQSEHRALPVGKELIQRFYGKAPARSYFEGCSMGGHDAMMQAQRWPQDFDGIVARAPAGNIMGLFMQFNRIAKQVRAGNGLNAAKQTLLANAVLAQCDALDGAADGIIGKPAACAFDAAALRCAGGTDSGDTCLSDAQIATVNTITSPIASADGAWLHTGYFFGAENTAKGWGEYIWTNTALGDSLQGLFSDGFVRSFVTRSPAFDTSTWSADQWLSEMSLVGSMFGAANPDLSGMLARGAKLIVWNGTTDTSVSPRDNARYLELVVAKMGQADADKVVEYFQAPGVGHCFGGVGPDKVDLLKALATWVEQGTAPSAQNLVHRLVDAQGATTMTRPLCKYPAYPRYSGSGSVNEAANFSCSTQ